MARERLIGVWAGDNWHLRGYAWRSPCVKSPLSEENMRAIVAIDTRGRYHPGLRNSNELGADYKTVYGDFSSYGDKQKAIDVAKLMLQEAVESHTQTRDHLLEETPQKAPQASPDPREIKRIVWTGPAAETDNGSLKFGVVGRTKGNSLRAGYGTISTGLSVEQGAGTREFYRWEPRQYEELGHAIFAAQTAVKREIDFWREPDRHQPEEKATSPAATEKSAPSKDSPQGRFDALLSKLRTPGRKKEAPAPSKRGWSIDR